jgi:dGTPase
MRAGLLREEDLPERPIAALGETGSQRIDALVHDMVEHSAKAGDIVQGPIAGPAMAELRKFMFEHVYLGKAVRAEHARIANVVRKLFEHYVEHPELLPSNGVASVSEAVIGASTDGDTDSLAGTLGMPRDDVAQRVTDYVAGMTDRYCIREYTDLEVPRVFAR